LHDLGVQTVLPPGYRCCGHPQHGNGMEELAEKIITRNRVLFHRVANTRNYMDIKTVLVSCGTCLHELREYNFEKIFPGCRVMDIHDYLREKGVHMKGAENVRYLYHDPCHTPLKEADPLETVQALLETADGSPILKSDRCCAESGTFAVARPDISNQLRFAKEKSLREAAEAQTSDGFRGEIRVLTTCPGCLQGISRYEDAVKTKTEFLVVEMARNAYGDHWMEKIVAKLKENGIEKVLL
jgi:Fe-S oxidoreductase